MAGVWSLRFGRKGRPLRVRTHLFGVSAGVIKLCPRKGYEQMPFREEPLQMIFSLQMPCFHFVLVPAIRLTMCGDTFCMCSPWWTLEAPHKDQFFSFNCLQTYRPSMTLLGVKSGLEMILGHVSPVSLNMHPYWAMWTHLGQNFIMLSRCLQDFHGPEINDCS